MLAALDGLPLGSYVVGDAAYRLSDKCITPFVGSQQLNPTKDAYNYFLSQVEIDGIIPVPTSPLGWGYLPTVEPLHVPSVPATSKVYDAVLGMVSRNGFGRPAHNIEKA